MIKLTQRVHVNACPQKILSYNLSNKGAVHQALSATAPLYYKHSLLLPNIL